MYKKVIINVFSLNSFHFLHQFLWILLISTPETTCNFQLRLATVRLSSHLHLFSAPTMRCRFLLSPVFFICASTSERFPCLISASTCFYKDKCTIFQCMCSCIYEFKPTTLFIHNDLTSFIKILTRSIRKHFTTAITFASKFVMILV